jgi:hypothetical protein
VGVIEVGSIPRNLNPIFGDSGTGSGLAGWVCAKWILSRFLGEGGVILDIFFPHNSKVYKHEIKQMVFSCSPLYFVISNFFQSLMNITFRPVELKKKKLINQKPKKAGVKRYDLGWQLDKAKHICPLFPIIWRTKSITSFNVLFDFVQYPPEVSVRARESFGKMRFSKRPIFSKFAGNVGMKEGNYANFFL